MAIIKCKMCGGDIELSADKTFGTCEYCGCTMTLPKVDNDQRAAAFNRGNHFRRIGEFDKALAVYERIVAEDNTDAEAHWCCALCRFGIEYVEDPTTYEWLPTCHRASFDSILEDVDYLAAVEYSDGITKRQYQKDAAKIAEVQRGILATSQREEPFDVFICYKESDENGNRTVDSTLAQDIYYQLADKGYRVFFSRITLEDKVGAEYEPYIFAALNSAKVMIVVGTKPEHFSAVWVKNEWSRFLALMRKDRSKLLLPCYRDMDPYDLPEQLSVLQSYDMAKIGFIQDLIRGVSKVLDADKEQPAVKETVIVQSEGGSNLIALLKRGQMALEDEEWEKADDFFEQVLNQDAECAEAYFGKAMAEAHAQNQNIYRLLYTSDEVQETSSLMRAKKYSSSELSSWLKMIDDERDKEAKRKLAELEKKKQQESERRAKLIPFFATIRRKQSVFNQSIVITDDIIVGNRSDGTVAVVAEESSKTRLFKFNNYNDLFDWRYIVSLATSETHTVGLRADGTVVSVGYNKYGQCNVSDWTDIVAISVDNTYTVGLRRNGTVLAVGENKKGRCNVANWTDIVAVSADCTHTVGLRSDGTVLAVGDNEYGQCNVTDWNSIVAIFTGPRFTVGLRTDGTCVAVGEHFPSFWNVSNWEKIVSVSTNVSGVIGLCENGTVVTTGTNWTNQLDVVEWSDIISVSSTSRNTIGLCANGKVVAAGENKHGQCDVFDWSNVVAIFVNDYNTVGLCKNGNILVAGQKQQLDVSAFRLFHNYENFEVEQNAMKNKSIQENSRRISERIDTLEQTRKKVTNTLEITNKNKQESIDELSHLKGFFSGRRRKQLESDITYFDKQIVELNNNLAELEKELSRLKNEQV